MVTFSWSILHNMVSQYAQYSNLQKGWGDSKMITPQIKNIYHFLLFYEFHLEAVLNGLLLPEVLIYIYTTYSHNVIKNCCHSFIRDHTLFTEPKGPGSLYRTPDKARGFVSKVIQERAALAGYVRHRKNRIQTLQERWRGLVALNISI